MPDLDLIPIRYLARQRTRAWFIRGLLFYVGVAMLIFGCRVYLEVSIQKQEQAIAHLSVERQRMEQELDRLKALRQTQESLSQQLAVLEGLRGGVPAIEMFSVMDEALNSDVWFKNWTFRRAGEIVAQEPNAVQTGYFIVLPKVSEDSPPQAWRLRTHMEIDAESKDHSALAGFVRRLSEKGEIESARILNTKNQGQAAAERIDFELAVLVRSQP